MSCCLRSILGLSVYFLLAMSNISSVQAVQCAQLLAETRPVGEELEPHFIAYREHYGARYNNHPSYRALIFQVVVMTGKGFAEVEQLFNNFPDTGVPQDKIGHKLIAQTALLTDSDPQDVIHYFKEAESTGKRLSSNLDLIAIQTAFLSNRPLNEVSSFFENAPRLPWTAKSIMYAKVLQTAFLSGRSVGEVKVFFRREITWAAYFTVMFHSVFYQLSFPPSE